MITTSENATQKSITPPSRSVHHTSFLWALYQELVRSTTQRCPDCRGAGWPFFAIFAVAESCGELPAGSLPFAYEEVCGSVLLLRSLNGLSTDHSYLE